MVHAMPGTSQTGGDICDRRRAEIAGQIVSGTLSIQEACTRYQLSPELLLEWVAALRQASLTAFDEQVRRTLTDQGIDVSSLASAEFQGDLGQFTIADLIQTLTLGDRDGVITVSHDGRESRIWCSGGEIIDAESGRLTGIPAVHRLLALEQGRIRASFQRVQRGRRVHVSTMALLLDGARRGDECRLLRNRLGAGPYRASAEAPLQGWSAAEQELLGLCQTARSVPEVVAESELGDLETLTAVGELVERGWLVLDNATSAPAAPANVSSPPLVLSLARFPTSPATPRAHRRWALGLGMLSLALLTLPRYLLASRATGHALAAPAQAAGLQHSALPEGATASLPAPPADADRDPNSDPPRPAQTSDASSTLSAPAAAEPALAAELSPPGRETRARRRSPRSATTAPSPSRTFEAPSTAASVEPRMQLIEARQPQMQILE